MSQPGPSDHNEDICRLVDTMQNLSLESLQDSMVSALNHQGQCLLEEDPNYFFIFLESLFTKAKKATILSTAGAISAFVVNFIFHKLQTPKETTPSQTDNGSKSLIVRTQETISRSAVGSSAGFVSRVGINMITAGGTDIVVNIGSRVTADVAAKTSSTYAPQYTGQNHDSWTYTITKAATSALVGTITYSFSSQYTSPMASRCISASASAVSEQLFKLAYQELISSTKTSSPAKLKKPKNIKTL